MASVPLPPSASSSRNFRVTVLPMSSHTISRWRVLAAKPYESLGDSIARGKKFHQKFHIYPSITANVSPTSFRLCSCTRASLSRSTQHGSATRCARLMTFIRELVSIPPPAAPPGMVKQLTAPASARRCFLPVDAGRFVRQPIKRERHRGFFAPLASGRGNQRQRRLAGWQRGSATSPSRPPSPSLGRSAPRVFCRRSFPWQMITDLFFLCHHDLLVQRA